MTAREAFVGLSCDHFPGFREFRAAKARAAGSRFSEPATPAVEAVLPPRLQFYAEAGETRQAFAELLRRLKTRYRRRSTQAFAGGDKADHPILQELEEGCRLLQQLEQRVKTELAAPPAASFTVERVRQGMLNALQQALRRMSAELAREEETFLALKKKWEAGASAFDLLNDPPTPNGGRASEAQSQLTQEELSAENAQQLRSIVDRTSRISNMVGYVGGLAFEQGEVTDRIDHNLHVASTMTQKANKELVKARERLEKGWAARLIRLLIAANVVLFLLLLLKLS